MPYRKVIGATIGSARKKTTPAAEEARRQNGGSLFPSQRRNLRIPLQLAKLSTKESNKASMAVYPISLGSRTSRHQSVTKSRTLRGADGTYFGSWPKSRKRKHRGSVGTEWK